MYRNLICISFVFLVENQSIDKAAIVSPPRQVLPGYVAQQPPPHNNQIHLQTDFTSPPPTHPHGFWPQAFPNSWQTQFRMPSPAPQAKTTVTNTTTCNNNPPTFSSSSNSTIRSPLPRWRSFNNSARQRTPYQYGNTPRNNYPRQFSQNAVCYWEFYYYIYFIFYFCYLLIIFYRMGISLLILPKIPKHHHHRQHKIGLNLIKDLGLYQDNICV